MGYTPLVDQNTALILAVIFSIIGVAAFFWLVFFVQHSRELPPRDKLIGTTVRLITMAISLGIGLHFWTLIELF